MRHRPAHDLSRAYRCVSFLLGRAALRAQHVHLLFPSVMRVQCAKALWHMPPGNPDGTWTDCPQAALLVRIMPSLVTSAQTAGFFVCANCSSSSPLRTAVIRMLMTSGIANCVLTL